MTSKIKAIIFDCYGVLLFPAGLTEVLQSICTHYEIDFEIARKILYQHRMDWWLGKISSEKLFAKIIEKTHTPVTIKDFLMYLNSLVYSNKELFESLPILHLSFKLAVLSNTGDDFIWARKHFQLDDFFDLVVPSFEVQMKKPDKEIFDFILSKLDCKPEECFFIDDFEVNTLAAQALGFHTVLYTSTSDLRLQLKRFGIEV